MAKYHFWICLHSAQLLYLLPESIISCVLKGIVGETIIYVYRESFSSLEQEYLSEGGADCATQADRI